MVSVKITSKTDNNPNYFYNVTRVAYDEWFRFVKKHELTLEGISLAETSNGIAVEKTEWLVPNLGAIIMEASCSSYEWHQNFKFLGPMPLIILCHELARDYEDLKIYNVEKKLR